jgi:hypothetical protein
VKQLVADLIVDVQELDVAVGVIVIICRSRLMNKYADKEAPCSSLSAAFVALVVSLIFCLVLAT